MRKKVKDVAPTGDCWCGCGTATKPGMFFVVGHDKVAESALIEIEFGTVAGFLASYGYGADGMNIRAAIAAKRAGDLALWAKAKAPKK